MQVHSLITGKRIMQKTDGCHLVASGFSVFKRLKRPLRLTEPVQFMMSVPSRSA